MQFPVVLAVLFAAGVSARDFTLYSNVNFGGNAHRGTRSDDSACCTLPRDCTGSNWQNRGDAFTVPAHLDNHIQSFRNRC
ncbi:hypothetical protein B0T18DRAFT_333351 [Schizothecium vesticola]|uniref:Uncharacterized protein n=1 Tax=Schizothecium vesticola TaxID=314040 RepID=A0AA40BRI6_9PEZI|nr:hypothetical protein B0T18DRAFT_333351 [Schizothecium vesticola]